MTQSDITTIERAIVNAASQWPNTSKTARYHISQFVVLFAQALQDKTKLNTRELRDVFYMR